MFLTHWSTVFIPGHHDIVNKLGSHDVHTHTHTLSLSLSLNVRIPSESNWPDDVSIGTKTCCFLYCNKLYVSVVFWQNILPIVLLNTTGWLLLKYYKLCAMMHVWLHYLQSLAICCNVYSKYCNSFVRTVTLSRTKLCVYVHCLTLNVPN
jgi:hypothetical protein